MSRTISETTVIKYAEAYLSPIIYYCGDPIAAGVCSETQSNQRVVTLAHAIIVK
jgi:hypothetical protein